MPDHARARRRGYGPDMVKEVDAHGDAEGDYDREMTRERHAEVFGFSYAVARRKRYTVFHGVGRQHAVLSPSV